MKCNFVLETFLGMLLVQSFCQEIALTKIPDRQTTKFHIVKFYVYNFGARIDPTIPLQYI